VSLDIRLHQRVNELRKPCWSNTSRCTGAIRLQTADVYGVLGAGLALPQPRAVCPTLMP
jgi:hypothetical protein